MSKHVCLMYVCIWLTSTDQLNLDHHHHSIVVTDRLVLEKQEAGETVSGRRRLYLRARYSLARLETLSLPQQLRAALNSKRS